MGQPETEFVGHPATQVADQDGACVAKHQRGELRQLRRKGVRSRHQVTRLKHLADNAEPLSLLRANVLAGQQKISPAIGAEEHRPNDVDSIAWDCPAEGVRNIGELGVTGCQDDVA